MAATKVFASYATFLQREDKTVNGVSELFAKYNLYYIEQNKSNDGCWNCSDCSGCLGCSDCSGCSGCSDCSGCSGCSYETGMKKKEGETPAFIIPTIEDIHQKVYRAVTATPDSLNMGDWHTCDTTHCRGGWVEMLAGEAGRELAKRTSTLFAAMQIYHKSSPEIPVSPVRFFENNQEAMADMKRCADLEIAGNTK